jgi:uncharacterized protein with PQ loop repeat
MDTQQIMLLAGTISTSIFAVSHIPMLIRAFRTKDLRSYSPANLVLSNIGNAFHWLYIASLPFGPIWFLHSFYTLTAAIMLLWYLQHRRRWAGQKPLSANKKSVGARRGPLQRPGFRYWPRRS